MLSAIKDLFTTSKRKIGNHSVHYIVRNHNTQFVHFYYKNTLVAVIDYDKNEFVLNGGDIPKNVVSSYRVAHEKFHSNYSLRLID